MKRNIVYIEEEKCTGCGKCASICHEGAIAMVNGKAKLIKDDYCDGLGDCLPACPADAIRIIQREAEEYDHEATLEHMRKLKREKNRWPVQIRLVNPDTDRFDGEDLVVAADCCGYVCKNLSEQYIGDRLVVIGCPKLDAFQYQIWFSILFKQHNVKSITLLRMTVPCCQGLQKAIQNAIGQSGKNIPFTTIVLDNTGKEECRFETE
ncbi:MAG: 4Fe-4S binding protein [Erysipelotrichaceae bacterium]|nr:4Fe-4S binding protein [Erysipelotrichaceae bacterium]